ncbi:hypothetical protein DICSQDRAFT_173218 [Dichomitus squalens LYAD-421 SS1]|uniref:GST N-terminal domain-containing protein n=1 Tax=Dichomitus squalens (strain LYAD-421) TaxID=732165 RepID=R7SPL9_DICSQ|nr:uncharacterized protein DICSQDRAFT_173218 [Dichomitus squalens LYAD-421 SS1]EJF58124.1 hypothetical protein DICSQDRAFT_173218 [Dichomitus squalens LYAD-421 SS1]
MVQNGQITFYTHVYSPYCHRVHIALEQAKANYTSVNINLMDKPEWYDKKINTVTGKIPALTYGGPKHPPGEPSPEAAVLVESGAILEFLHETFPEALLLPSDPIRRANARIFVSIVDNKLMDVFRAYFVDGAPASTLLAGFEALQVRLPPVGADRKGGFAVGEWSIGDIAAAPLLARIVMLLEHDIGRFEEGDGPKTLALLRGPKYARIMKYLEDAKRWPSFVATWDEPTVLAIWQSNPFFQRS